MARIGFGGKVELAILALTLAVHITKLIRERQAQKRTIKIKTER